MTRILVTLQLNIFLLSGGEKQRVESKYFFYIQLCELRVYFNRTTAGDCWNSGKTDRDIFGELHLVEYELRVFYNSLRG